ncbi:MAG: hypothetical protein PCALPYG88_6887 [uncultured Paraburkholderia sp.]|nr:MAG: hypothetical protein PCALPYG08_7281 [uncultured Paraburkholderia sp.]CAH2941116.1 MAG: hypothetical protein PCALPYG88_6887 [uncultured Paraburkholderia sp.]
MMSSARVAALRWRVRAGRALERSRQIGAMTTEGGSGELPANPADHASRRLPPPSACGQ